MPGKRYIGKSKGPVAVSPLVRQLSWTHHLIIMGQSKRAEEPEFYMRLGTLRANFRAYSIGRNLSDQAT